MISLINKKINKHVADPKDTETRRIAPMFPGSHGKIYAAVFAKKVNACREKHLHKHGVHGVLPPIANQIRDGHVALGIGIPRAGSYAALQGNIP